MKTFNLKKLEIGGGIPKIAVPVQGKTAGELLSAVPPADAAADLLEIRLDSLDSFRDEKTLLLLSRRLRELTRKPLLFTLRTAPEGGSAEVSETEYASVLRFLLRECRPDLLDVEFLRGAARELLSEARRSAVPTVASCHDFRKTPEAAFIEKMFRQMSEAGASVAKAALMPVNEADVEKVLSAGLSLKKTLGRFDVSRYGGAPVLGLKSLVVKMHGSAKANEVHRAIEQCVQFYREEIAEKITAYINSEKA